MTEPINLKPERTYAEHEIWICTDCAMWTANGDSSGMEPEDEQRVIAAEADAANRGWSVIITDEFHEFSKNRCDLCSSPLHGSRFEALLMSRDSGETAAEQSLVIQRDGSGAYTVEELLQLMISDIKAIQPEIEIPDPTDDLEELIWSAQIVQSRAADLGLYVIEDDGYWIYDLRLISEAAAESFGLMEEER